jgi:hypothetical protein
MKEGTFNERLPVRLDEVTLKERALELAGKIEEHDRLEKDRKEQAKAMKEEVDAAGNEVRRLAGIVKTGEEPREVEVRWDPNHAERTMELLRLDTGELVRSRPMDKPEIHKYLTGDLFTKGSGPRPARPEDAN